MRQGSQITDETLKPLVEGDGRSDALRSVGRYRVRPLRASTKFLICLLAAFATAWLAQIQQFQWDLDRVNGELEKKMRKAYADVAAQARSSKVSLRTAAFILAIKRVARAAVTRRHTNVALPSSLN